jgi:predicted DNA-binding mobile mystery protein A
MKTNTLAQDQFDRNLPSLIDNARAITHNAPEAGWVRTLRQLLQMSSTALAKRLGIAHSGLHKIEKGERGGTVSIATLRRVAAALDADFVYAIVPRKPLRDMLHNRALEIARDHLQSPSSAAAVENQPFSGEQLELRIQALADQLKTRPRRLWR